MSNISNPPVNWQPDPDFRGTFNIVSTCLTTLLLCLWSAVHVDVPSHSGKCRGLWVRVGWISVGLVTPETLLFIAYRQWTIAGEIFAVANPFEASTKSWHRLFLQLKEYLKWGGPQNNGYGEIQDCSRKHPWTMMHSYYAAMGGFVFDTQTEDFLPASYRNGRAIITPEGIQFLLRNQPDLLPDLSTEEISDRSKANGLSKSVVVVQVTFFLVNCIARKIQRLPVTLLEVTTVAHALCSLLAYAFWWNKPLSVSHPTLIRGEVAMRTCALMCMASTCRYYFLAGYLMVWRPAELDSLCCHEIESLDAEKCPASDRDSKKHWPQIYFAPCPPDTVLKDGMSPWLDRVIGKRYLGPQPWYREWQNNIHDRESAPGAAPNLTDSDKRRWGLASSAPWRFLQNLETTRRISSDDADSEVTDVRRYTDALVSPNSCLSASLKSRGGNPRKITLNNNDPGPTAAPILALLFGFPSLTAWYYDFPTPFDQFLWRVAALAATFRGTVYWATRRLGLYVTHRTNNYLLRKAAAVIPVCLLMGMLVPSSIILVAESFKQLLYLPGAAYHLPMLTRYWPHF
ncbi:hypothetical protein C8J55DRAFT_440985 [Lentinula edodes]|uniref:Uncharacterized protein n=1 Tax=Lentinula lateritia TaxID=40482 RepID=A0A9W9DDU8_9AGAR|nr:hypothetical protein C8J55DRAFT_440985 [Lentinula edodes]